jgi:mono/diheme cytochrome c family protein
MAVVRRLLKIIAFVIVLVIVLVGALWGWGQRKANMSLTTPVTDLVARSDSLSLARGEHLAGISCVACHSPHEQLPLSGPDTAFVDAPPFGTIHPANLTPGGVLPNYSDGQLARAVREGVDRNGRPLVIMPSRAFHGMSDADVASLIGYLHRQPAVAHATLPRRIGPVLALLIGAGQIPTSVQPAITGPVPEAVVAATSDYGHYLAPIYGCTECHGQDLHGIAPSGHGPPPGPDLIAFARRNSYPQFEQAVRHGINPTGRMLSPEMPWSIFARMDDVEVQALYAYLKTF